MSTLLEKLLRGEAVRQTREAPLSPRAPGSHSPIAPVQMQTWLDAQLDPESPAFNVTVALEFAGPLDRRAIERALASLAHRHEILRTAFAYIDGQVVQVVYDQQRIDLPFHDLRTSAPGQSTRLEFYDASRPFDTGVGPLWRARLFQLAEDRWRLHLTLHQLICDATSLHSVIAPELIALYQGAELPAPVLQYADFALWQRKLIDNQVASRQIEYWRTRLQGAPASQVQPPRPSSSETIAIPASTRAAVERAASAEGVTPEVFLHAAFFALQYRYTGQRDLCFAARHQSSGRDEFAGIAGNFTNLVALRVPLHGAVTVGHLLRDLRDASLAAASNGEAPFDQVARAMKLGGTSILQAAVSTSSAIELAPDWTLTAGSRPGHARYPLELHLETTQAHFEYQTDRYDAPLIQRMAEHWLTLAAAMASNPEARIAELPLLSKSQTEALTSRGQGSIHALPEQPLHELFQAQAARVPKAIAVECDGVKLTYRELNQEANVLARRLRQENLEPGEPVGVTVERGCDLAVAILAILKAGGAFTNELPAARVAVIGREGADIPGMCTVYCDESGGSDRNLGHTSMCSDVACLAAGASVEHRTIVNAVQSMQNETGFAEHSAMLAVSPLSSPAAAIEFFLPLLTGGRLVIARNTDWMDETLAESPVTTMQASPEVWQGLVDRGWTGDRKLTAIANGPLSAPLADALLDRTKEVWSTYGQPLPLAIRRFAGDEPFSAGIGHALDNTRLYVLDGDGNLAPEGAVGNLWVSGVALGRGEAERNTGHRARWRTASGKEAVLEIVTPPPPRAPASPREPSNDIERKLAEMFKQISGATLCTAASDFFRLGGHPLLTAKLVRRIEHELGVRIAMAQVYAAPTVEQLAQVLIERGAKPSANSIARAIPTRREHRQLLWINAGAEYRDLAERVGLPFRGIALDPIDQDSLPADCPLQQIAACLVRTLRGHQPEGPYYLAGTGASALLAYETAVQLEAAGQRVATVLLVEPTVPKRGFLSRLWDSVPPFEQTLERAAREYKLQPLAIPVAVFQAEQRAASADLRVTWSKAPAAWVEVIGVGGDSRHPETMYQQPYAAGLGASIREVIEKWATSAPMARRQRA